MSVPAGHGEAVTGRGAGGWFLFMLYFPSPACGAKGEGRAQGGGRLVVEPAYIDKCGAVPEAARRVVSHIAFCSAYISRIVCRPLFVCVCFPPLLSEKTVPAALTAKHFLREILNRK